MNQPIYRLGDYRDFEAPFFLALLSLFPLGHGIWCWSTGVYAARSIRFERTSSPLGYWFCLATDFVMGLLMLGGAILIAVSVSQRPLL